MFSSHNADIDEGGGVDKTKTPPEQRTSQASIMHLWSAQATICLIFRLPREIRDIIYSHFIGDDESDDQTVHASGFDTLQLESDVKILRGIDDDGRAQREAMELFFRTRTFVFDSSSSIRGMQATAERMRLRAIDVYDELRRVEVVGWTRTGDYLNTNSPFQWARTRNFFRACVQHLTQCTGLTTVKLYLDAEPFYLDDVRPLFGLVSGRILFEVCWDDDVEKKYLEGNEDSIRRFLDAERILVNTGFTVAWKHVSRMLEDSEH